MGKTNFTSVEFKTVHDPKDFEIAVELFREYERSLDFKIDFQNFEEEIESITKMYVKPHGSLILAFWGNTPVGIIGLRKWDSEIGEIKRMYVQPDYRKRKIGFELLRLILETAKKLEYKKVRLDSLERMQSAVKLYQDFEFYFIEAYCENPLPDAIYMEKKI